MVRLPSHDLFGLDSQINKNQHKCISLVFQHVFICFCLLFFLPKGLKIRSIFLTVTGELDLKTRNLDLRVLFNTHPSKWRLTLNHWNLRVPRKPPHKEIASHIKGLWITIAQGLISRGRHFGEDEPGWNRNGVDKFLEVQPREWDGSAKSLPAFHLERNQPQQQRNLFHNKRSSSLAL